MKPLRQRLYEAGGRISELGANFAGHPAAILGMALFCLAWFLVAGEKGENALTLVLSVLAITLTQMVLNQQRKSERALHLKIDELLYAQSEARDEVAEIEGLTELEIESLRRGHARRVKAQGVQA